MIRYISHLAGGAISLVRSTSLPTFALSSAGSPSAGSGLGVQFAFIVQDNAIIRFCCIWFNQTMVHIPRDQRWVASEGITIPTTARHFDNEPVTSRDDLQPLDRE